VSDYPSTGYVDWNYKPIPSGWARVEQWFRVGDEKECDAYVGPVLEETYDHIVLEIEGQRRTFRKWRYNDRDKPLGQMSTQITKGV